MNFKNQSFSKSVSNAIKGIKIALISERNIKIQLTMLILVAVFGWILKFSNIEWAIIILTSIGVLVAELINTSIEMTIDMFCHNEFNLLAKKSKDIAAGAVLLTSVGALIIGSIVIIPKIIAIIK